MQWLNRLVDSIIERFPEGDLLVESGASPSGTYHIGHLREIITCDAVLLELRRRGRNVRHIQFVDDLDGLRKIPINLPASYEQYLGKPLCDIPAPEGELSLADFFLNDFANTAQKLGIEMELVRSHAKYRDGFFTEAIERVLERLPEARNAITKASERKLDEHWSPIQIMDNGYLKNRRFLDFDADAKTVRYAMPDGEERTVRYDDGQVKLDWRLDWPARWWKLGVNVEPFGRDHASAGGSYDTGCVLMEDVFDALPPIPVPYDFINRAGDTKKMSASKGTGISAAEMAEILPAELMRFFVLRYAPEKRLYFDEGVGVMRLFDEFAELLAKPDKTADETQLLDLCRAPMGDRVVISRIPFSHVVSSYQAALRDTDKTLELLKRTEHADTVAADEQVIREELKFIDKWLDHWAPEEVRFALQDTVKQEFSETQRAFLQKLASKVAAAPQEADGEWFHNTIYDLKGESGLSPKEMFTTLYQVLIGKDAGPRAGWFLSILPRDWLVQRLKLEA